MTQFQKLQQVVENPKAYGLAKNSNAYKSIKSLSECGKGYTAQSGYRLGWATKSDWTVTVENVLKKIGIAYDVRNDAPRGGANGKHIVLTGKAIVKDITNARREREEAEKEEMRRAKAEKEAKR